jgi:hypothetical protein
MTRRLSFHAPWTATAPSPSWWAAFLAGAAWSILMALRCQVHGDALNMLVRGWELAVEGVWMPYGLPTSAGGFSPGGLMAAVVGLPITVWSDYRAVAVLTAVIHACAFLWMVRAIGPTLRPFGTWALLVALWLDPWRMVFSTHPWNVNFMLPLGMVHLATAVSMRHRKVAWATCVHALTVGLGMQLHTSFAVLAVLSLLLWLTGTVRVHWGGFAAAVTVVLATLVPWVVAVVDDPNLLPADEGFPLRGLLLVYPLLRGVLYWLKLGSLSLPSRLTAFDFSPDLGAAADTVLTPAATALAIAGHVTIVVAVWATWRLVRRAVRSRVWRRPAPATSRAWLERYVALAGVAALVSFAVSPTTVMFWQLFVIQHAIALAVVFPVTALARTRAVARVRRGVVVWTVVAVLLVVAITFGAPMYRQGGRRAVVLEMRHDHPLFHELGLVRHGSVTTDSDAPDAWWPNGLEPEPDDD